MLGFIHKRVLNQCHPSMFSLFPFTPGRYHDRELQSEFGTVRGHGRLYERTIYMYVLMYNRLPEDFVEMSTVSTFQGKLTKLAKARADRQEAAWRCAYKDCRKLWISFMLKLKCL